MTTASDNQKDVINILRSSEGGLGSFMTEEEIQEYESRYLNHQEKIGPVNTEAFLQAAEESFKLMPLSMLRSNK